MIDERRGRATRLQHAAWWHLKEMDRKGCSHFRNNFEDEDLLNYFEGKDIVANEVRGRGKVGNPPIRFLYQKMLPYMAIFDLYNPFVR